LTVCRKLQRESQHGAFHFKVRAILGVRLATGIPLESIDFLFDPNRLNVAVSRAQSLTILVGHPSLARTSCSTLDQMARVNMIARAKQKETLPARRDQIIPR
jgi:hypothetical protein